MSFDRVLPKPPALRCEASQGPMPRKTSTLLEHKIINDDSSKMVIDQPQLEKGAASASCRYAADIRPSGVSSLSLNRAKISLNKNACSAPPLDHSKPSAHVLTKDIPIRDRSSSTSPVKSAVKEPAQFCLCQPDPKIPRPRNAFILYRQHYQAAVVAQNPGLANPEISKIIGEHWRALPDETKDEWKALAEEEKARHQQQYPDYRYQPRRYGRDGNSRGSSGLSHNPPGSTVCSRCGGRVMNPPISPETPFTPNGSGHSATSPHPNMVISRRLGCRQRDSVRVPSPVKVSSAVEMRSSVQRHLEENGLRSPDSKRRRFNSQGIFKPNIHRERSPVSPYPLTSYTPRSESSHPRGLIQAIHLPRSSRSGREHPPHDPSLKLPPLQTSPPPAPAMTPMTPFSQDGSSLETTVMGIPVLNKIKVLARICPPLSPSFQQTEGPRRGPVIAVDGQDPTLVASVAEYLSTALKKEDKYYVRIFEGPELGPHTNSESGHATLDYVDTMSVWHRISKEIINFVKSSPEDKTSEEVSSGVSPKTIIPQTANLKIESPKQDSRIDPTPSPARSVTSHIPVALVPRYQLSTSDSFACAVPIDDTYSPLDHWQWMASLWRSCVGPDITVYIRECEKEELDRMGGNAVEVRLQDSRTIIVRRVAGTPLGLEEKVLKRLGFELEDFLAQ